MEQFFLLKYKIDINNQKVKLFGDDFVEKNRNKCSLIIGKKEYNLINNINAPIYKKNKFFDVILIIKKPLNSLKDMFSNCENLIAVVEYNLNTKKITDISNMFSECTNLVNIKLSNWDTSKIKKMCSLFKNCNSLKQLPNIENWNTSNVEDMNSLFYGCSALLSLPNISKWNISKVKDINSMFEGCSQIKFMPNKFENVDKNFF
jgi:surface protein